MPFRSEAGRARTALARAGPPLVLWNAADCLTGDFVPDDRSARGFLGAGEVPSGHRAVEFAGRLSREWLRVKDMAPDAIEALQMSSRQD